MELELEKQVEDKTLLDYINTLKEHQINSEIKKLKKQLKEENDIMKQAEIGLKIAKLKQEL